MARITQREITVANFTVSNDKPLVIFGGLNVLESFELAQQTAQVFQETTDTLNMPYVFKASFDKANRSSMHSFRGPGLARGLKYLADIKSQFNVPILTDVHEPEQAEAAAEVCDVIQIPAFLARQTDLVTAIARTGAVINIKKPQFIAPDEMRHIVHKCQEAGNNRILLCERGTCFGYHNLVVDMLGIDELKQSAWPVVFDVTHSLQRPGAKSDSADGRRQQVLALARAGVGLGLAGLFLEAHPEPDKALCDGPCALPLNLLKAFLQQINALDQQVKSFPELAIN